MKNVNAADIVKIVQEYSPYIKNLCHKYYINGGTPEDLYQEGIIGLLEACNNFNGDNLFEKKFEYFAKMCVKRQIIDAIRKAQNGGNLALNISPQPDGRLPGRALKELSVLSEWMNIFSSAIHGTRAAEPYRNGKIAYTRTKDGKKVYAFYLYDNDEVRKELYTIPFKLPIAVITDMRTGTILDFKQNADSISIRMPENLVKCIGDIADCFVLELKFRNV